MLRLEKLELIGFKSFLSRTEFHFTEEITAVVGPNGCGKSNIADALNWVIGEQSVKSLRGDRMEDVIFNGSESRRPLGMAEVSLHLKNGSDDGTEENLVVTRRLFRSGESEYLLNGSRTRLRDVQEALTRINVGSGLCAIIEQGKVDAALNSKPRDRRVLIEEAAGIALYKTRKRQAETKLEATQANLLRVNDIISEMERQIGSLKRQAAKARRYARTVEEITRNERVLLFHEHERLERERMTVEEREAAARALESEAGAALGLLEAAHEAERSRLDEQDMQVRRAQDELHALDRELDRHEHQIRMSREQAEQASAGRRAAGEQAAILTGRLEETGRQIESRRADRAGLERALAATTSDRERLETARGAVEARIQSLESDLAGMRTALLETVDALSNARNRCRQIDESRQRLGRQTGALDREELAALEDVRRCGEQTSSMEEAFSSAQAESARLLERLESARAEVARLSETLVRETARREESRHRTRGHEERLKAISEMEATTTGTRELLAGLASHDGILVDGLKAPAHVETAAEIYLAAFLDAALVDAPGQAYEGIASLKRAGRGRAAFLPVPGEDAGAASAVIALPEDMCTDPGFVGRMSDLIELDTVRRRAMAPALARVVVATDLEAAARLRRLGPFFDYVTLEGDILHTNGLMEGGARRPEGTGILTRRRLKSDLMQSIETGHAHLAALDALIDGLESEKSVAVAGQARLTAEFTDKEKELVALRLQVQTCVEEERRARSKVDTVSREKRIAAEESEALAVDLERITGMLAELEQLRRSRDEAITAAQDEIVSLRATASATGESLSTLRASLSAACERLEALDVELARILENDQDLRDRIAREALLESELRHREEEAARQGAASTAAIHELGARRETLLADVRDGEIALGERRLEFESLGRQTRTARAALEEARGVREQVSLEKERVIADLRHLIAGAATTAATEGAAGEPSFEQILATVTDEQRALDPGTVRETLSGLRELRDKMGPVNMLALDEFQELDERFTFLTAQRKDLTDAILSLKDTIARINRTSRERFMDAFEKVRAAFVEIFRTLFGGGRADLRLLTGDGEEDVLDCGLEIIAQPPGKRLQSITLMSGGEKALTATALLFAIFKYRPSPFCLLDEVDAPLDEANVMRFNQLLKSMSGSTQFVVITHNRFSMETADILYGITMEEPGVSHMISVVLGGDPDRAERVKSLPALLAARHRGLPRRPPLSVTGGNGSAIAPRITADGGGLPG